MSDIVHVFTTFERDGDGRVTNAHSSIIARDMDDVAGDHPPPFIWRFGDMFPESRLVVTEDDSIDLETAKKLVEQHPRAPKDAVRALSHAYAESANWLVEACNDAGDDTIQLSECREVPVVYAVVGDDRYEPRDGDQRLIDYIVDHAAEVLEAFEEVKDDSGYTDGDSDSDSDEADSDDAKAKAEVEEAAGTRTPPRRPSGDGEAPPNKKSKAA